MTHSQHRWTTDDFRQICSPKIGDLYKYWDSGRRGRRMPARRDIDPVDIPSLLSGLVLVDVEQQWPLKLRYRLVGTKQVEMRGRDPTGTDVLEAFYAVSKRNEAEQRQAVLESYKTVVDQRTLLYLNNPLYDPDHRCFYAERLFLPLSSDGEQVNMILYFAIWR